jgi:hypothetical protein
MCCQKSYKLLLFFSYNFDAYCRNSFSLLHTVVLRYEITPACNTWNIFAFSGAIEQLKAIKLFGSPLASFTSLLHPSDFPVFRLWQKSENRTFQRDYTGNVHCSQIQCQALPLQLKENIGLSMVTTKRLHQSSDTECIQFSVSAQWIWIL